tara:strand:- start:2399 stop:2560 length:162 start_codon:yes stop_codon:yes gene_type:complete
MAQRSEALKLAQQRYRLKNRDSINEKGKGYSKKHYYYKNWEKEIFSLFREMFG